jgi:hypothetical protein
MIRNLIMIAALRSPRSRRTETDRIGPNLNGWREPKSCRRKSHLLSALADFDDANSSNIDVLNDTMMTALKEVERKTGFIGTVLLAGPEPSQGGNITLIEWVRCFHRYILSRSSTYCLFRIHKGCSLYASKDFGLVYRDYAVNVRKPFHEFASRAFCEFAEGCIGWASFS